MEGPLYTKTTQERVILPADMVKEIVQEQEGMGSSLTRNQAELLADEGLHIRRQIKKLETQLETIKGDLLTYVKSNHIKEVTGENGRFIALDEERWDISNTRLIQWLEQQGKLSMLPKLITVVKKRIEHELGGHVLPFIGKQSRREYAKCIFKSKEEEG